MVNFQDFPNEIIAYIVTFLKARDILRFSYVSNQMYSICENDFIWKTKIKKDYPHVNIKNVKSYKKAYFKTNFTVLLYADPYGQNNTRTQNIGKNAYCDNILRSMFCSILSTAVSDSEEEDKNNRKRTCGILQEIYSYKDEIITDLMENRDVQTDCINRYGSVVTDHLFFYSEEINRDLKNIYLFVSYYRDADLPGDKIIEVNMAKFFETKEEIEEWLEENLSSVSQTIYNLKETKEYEYNERTKLPYSERVHRIIKALKKFGSCELYYGHPMKAWRPFDGILVFKIPVCNQEKDEDGFIFYPCPGSS